MRTSQKTSFTRFSSPLVSINLPYLIALVEIWLTFQPKGEIKSVEIPKDKETKKHKGFAFIEFEEVEDPIHAIDNMHESQLYGKVIKVQKARKDLGAKHKAVWEEKDYEEKYGTIEDRMKAKNEALKNGPHGDKNGEGAMDALEKEARI